ncbi:MAG: AAA family ATPase [Lachnospiraceae bacterium]|jgi:hypothetical protein
MNIKRAKQEIKDTIEAYLMKDEMGEYAIPSIRQRPVLLIGPPGVGKTQIMEQAARECGIGLVSYTITHHTRQSAVGLPFIEKRQFGGREYTATEYTMSEIVASVYNKMEETGLSEGILFIDEINCVSETLAPAMLQFLQCKTFGSHKIPDGWVIAAAGNPPEYNKSVREFDVVTLDRIKKIYVEPDYEAWKEYASREMIHPAIQSYLSIKPQNLCQIETTVDGKFFATPRGWEDLSELIGVYEKLGKNVDREVIGQYLQYPKIAKDFANYLELYNRYRSQYQVEEILNGVIRENVCNQAAKASFDERFSLVGLLLSRLSSQFADCRKQSDEMELLMKQLRRFPEIGDLDQITADFDTEYRDKKKAELLNTRQDRSYRQVLSVLESWNQERKAAGMQDKEEIWQQLRVWFGEKSDCYEELVQKSGGMLEHAFDFMEAAFGDSQEMVMFVTELNSRYYSVSFLQEYQCDRYYEYNKRLLFDDREAEILKQLDAAGV